MSLCRVAFFKPLENSVLIFFIFYFCLSLTLLPHWATRQPCYAQRGYFNSFAGVAFMGVLLHLRQGLLFYFLFFVYRSRSYRTELRAKMFVHNEAI